MGKIAELLEKKALGTITDEEKKELNTLLKEAEVAQEGDGKNGEGEGEGSGNEGDEDAAVDELAQKLADSVTSKINKGMEKVLGTLEEKSTVVTGGNSPVFIVDKKLGKKSVDELAEIKIKVAGREGKKHKEVSMKTVHMVAALIEGDKQKLQLLLEGTGARGGYLVPEEFANMIVEDIRDQAIMRQLASQMTISGDTLHLPSLASRPKAQWRSEAAVKATSTVDFGEQVFTPYSLASIVGLSNELAADASLGVNGSLVNYVAQLMATSLNEKEEQAFWTGDGSGKPTGVDNYTFRTVTATGSASVQADAIISAVQRTPQGYRNRGVFVGNSWTLETIAKFKDTNGNYLLSNLGDAAAVRLRGRPVYEQNDIPNGKLFYGDFSYYQIVDREGISVRISDEATVAGNSAFERNLTYVRVEKRVDGEMMLTAPVTEVQGL